MTMAMHFNKLVGVAALLMSGATMAQEQPAQQTTATTTQQSPSETQIPTTNSMTGSRTVTELDDHGDDDQCRRGSGCHGCGCEGRRVGL